MRTISKICIITNIILLQVSSASYALPIEQVQHLCSSIKQFHDQAKSLKVEEVYCKHMLLSADRLYTYPESNKARFKVIYNPYYHLNGHKKSSMVPVSFIKTSTYCSTFSNINNTGCTHLAVSLPDINFAPNSEKALTLQRDFIAHSKLVNEGPKHTKGISPQPALDSKLGLTIRY
ncbi:hypothetical protein A7985_13285 [Pseudoalteromonas luteoviolacea]|uniref:Uncharacterized protein n=1 Tax=Pseudoalteromonas luteoviolacea TaxID=43657 RepID=A0A1C0TPA6_9GAMM|nr:hypothetical protein [Pseudoalteromonas luteoviolacea]OCQ20771.1 hypothetical protein A7985_13285 [Pseudoalteromonas luteoviolacea]